jgi:hypothetical protein
LPRAIAGISYYYWLFLAVIGVLLAVIFHRCCRKPNISAAEVKTLAVFLVYYQRDQRRLRRSGGEVAREAGGGWSNIPVKY